MNIINCILTAASEFFRSFFTRKNGRGYSAVYISGAAPVRTCVAAGIAAVGICLAVLYCSKKSEEEH